MADTEADTAAGEPSRLQRLVFGEDAELYDRARPPYPDAAFALVDELYPTAGQALDVGCGTGKATVPLAERGWSGVGLEPDAAMLGRWRHNVDRFGARWLAVEHEFESWTPPAKGFDLLICAQAWHWLTPELRTERAWQALRPGGWLVLLWNRPAPGGNPLRAEFDRVYATVTPELTAREPGGKGEPPEDEIGAATPFGERVAETIVWEHSQTTEQYLANLASQSDHRLLAADRRAELFEGLAAVIDESGGSIRLGQLTSFWAAQRS